MDDPVCGVCMLPVDYEGCGCDAALERGERMVDIVDRLRAPSGGVVADTQIIEAACEAADEIEALRSALEPFSDALRSTIASIGSEAYLRNMVTANCVSQPYLLMEHFFAASEVMPTKPTGR